MNAEPLLYIVKVLVCSGILWLFYRLLLDGRLSFGWSRFYLLTAMVLSAVIPYLRIPLYPGDVIYAGAPTGYDLVKMSVLPENQADVTMIVYFGVVALVFAGIVYQFLRIALIHHKGQKIVCRAYTVVTHRSIKTPFSFFRSIFLTHYDDTPETAQIITHEQSHLRHHHSLDLIFSEIIYALLWFNPFVLIMRRSLVEVHEYQADRDVLQEGYDPVAYKTLIFTQLMGYSPQMTNRLNHSLTKKRFIMMTKQTRSRHALLKGALALPLIASLMLLFSFTQKPPQVIYSEEPAAAPKLQQQEQQKITKSNDSTSTKYNITINRDDELSTKGKINMIVVKGNGSNEKKEILVFVDGKKINSKAMSDLDPNDIASVSVLKNDAALAKYGKEGENGVVLITTKANEGAAGEASTAFTTTKTISRPDTVAVQISNESTGLQVVSEKTKSADVKVIPAEKAPLIVVDGVVYTGSMGKIAPDDIASITVLKNESATQLYGPKAKNGVIVVTMKENSKGQKQK